MARRGASVDRFGRLAVGQLVRYERSMNPPNTYPDDPPMPFLRDEFLLIGIVQFCEVLEIRLGEVDAFVTLRTDGGQVFTHTFNWWGQGPGDSRMAYVVREAPEQRSLIRETA